MIARIQQYTTLALIAAACGWAVVFGLRGAPAFAAGGALLILLGYALFLAAEFLLLAAFGSDPSVARPSFWQLLRAWAGEVAHAPVVFCWRQPFRSRSVSDSLESRIPGQRGVVLVHGFFCNRGFWNPWLKTFLARDIPFVAVNLEPPFDSITAYARIVEAAVARLQAATGLAPVVVAHSMGGLAVRAWLAGRGDATPPHRIVTIASPHRGTWLARFAHTVNGLEMRSPSDWIEALAARESPDYQRRFTCFYGHCDNIVFPASVAMLPGADNRHVPATAHVHMAYRPAVMIEVLRWLQPTAADCDPAGAASTPSDTADLDARLRRG